jgi:hypothetical protein
MNLDAITLHLQVNGVAYFVGAMVVIPLLVVFRKYTLPFLYHTVEYVAYVTIAHVFIGGLVRTFSWFRGETSFKNYNGDLSADFKPFTTPMTGEVWNRSLYTPLWVFWFEVVVAVILLYVVVFVRPIKFHNKTYSNKKPAPGKLSSRMGSRQGRAGAK